MPPTRTTSPRFLARVAFALGFLEGLASVWGGLRIPGRLVVSADAATTATNLLGNESLWRLGILLGILAVALNAARTVFVCRLFRPAGKTAVLLIAFLGLMAFALQGGAVLVQLPVTIVLKNPKDFGGFDVAQLQSLALLLVRWNGAAFNLYLAFFGLWSLVVGWAIWQSRFLPRVLGVLVAMAGVGYATYFWPPLANALYPWNLMLGAGELALGFWLLVFGVNAERWHEQLRITHALEAGAYERDESALR
jgi:hypothetical protein